MFTEKQLDDMLSMPSDALIRDMAELDGDILVLGAGGKIGPTLALMASRACAAAGKGQTVTAVSRFTDAAVVQFLEENGVRCLKCDLTDAGQVRSLPDAGNVVFMAGRKFGTNGAESDTWAMNVSVPTLVADRFRDARYTVFSTGNVYPLSPVAGGGSTEADAVGPVGEYAMSCLGRERVFEQAAKRYGAKVCMYRLNYAVDLRYGVLCDIGTRILAGEPVSLRTPVFNCVWQGYANEIALRSLLLAANPVVRLNVTGPETVSVRWAANLLGEYLGKAPVFEGEEGDNALLSNAGLCVEKFGYPEYGVRQLIRWQADWLLGNGRLLGKPTHFEERKGSF